MTKTFRLPRIALQCVLVFSLTLMYLQLVEGQSSTPNATGVSSVPDFQTFEHIGLESGLMVAVVVLWRTLQTERASSNAILKTSTEALSTTAAANAELRRIIEESMKANNEMNGSLKDLVKVIAFMNVQLEKIETHPCLMTANLGGRAGN